MKTKIAFGLILSSFFVLSNNVFGDTQPIGYLYSSPIFGSTAQKSAVVYVTNISSSPISIKDAQILDLGGFVLSKSEDTCNSIRLPAKKSCYIRATIYNSAAYSSSVTIGAPTADTTSIRAVLEIRGDTSTINSQILR